MQLPYGTTSYMTGFLQLKLCCMYFVNIYFLLIKIPKEVNSDIDAKGISNKFYMHIYLKEYELSVHELNIFLPSY